MVLLILAECQGQIISGPAVSGNFEQVMLKEDFDSITQQWPVTNNADNLLLIQNGEMIIHRKNEFAPLAVIGSYGFISELNDFSIVTSFKLTKAGDEGAIGLFFMAQDEGEGGLVFEINRTQQYRLKQITEKGYKIISGEVKYNGWVKSQKIKATDWNTVEVRTHDRKYDIYLNNNYLLSFTAMEYRRGGIGYITGPASKAEIDYLYVYNDGAVKAVENSAVVPDSGADKDVVSLTESVIKLQNQANSLKAENEELRKLIKLQQTETKESQKDIAQHKEDINSLQKSLSALRQTSDSLLKVNEELLKYKTKTEESANGEVLMTLSKSLKASKEKNEALQKEVDALKDEIVKLKAPGNN